MHARQHIHIFRCPWTGNGLRFATGDEHERALDAYLQQHGPHALVPDDLLIDNTGSYAYPILGGITHLLIDSAIGLAGPTSISQASRRNSPDLNEIAKKDVRQFYDEVGWHRGSHSYVDTELFVDRREPVRSYQRRVATRIADVLAGGGRYLVDVASGPVPDGLNTGYALPYTYHVCVDISLTALQEAQENLGSKGVFVLGDITNLPLADSIADGVACLHTIYHVPKDEQEKAFLEVHRILKPRATAAIAYNWGKHAFLMNLITLPVQVYKFVSKRIGHTRTGGDLAKLYFYAHSRKWFESRNWPFSYELRALQIPNKAFFSLFVHEGLGAHRILRFVAAIEEHHPSLAARLAYYPLLLIKKDATS